MNSEKDLDLDVCIRNPEMSSDHCNAILKRLEKRSNDDETLRYFKWMKRNEKLDKNLTAYNLILRVLGRKEEWHVAEELIREMVANVGSDINCQTFNSLIYVCYKRGLTELGAKWFSLMLEYGVRPNVATFGMLMCLYQKGGRIEDAEFAFDKMRDLEVTCQYAYSAMITIYTRMGLYNKAETIIQLLVEDEVTLDLENWLVLLNAYSQQGKLSEAEKVMLSMYDSGFPPNIVAYNTMITGYGKASNMDSAQRMFDELEKTGLKPDETTYRSMIEGWGRANNYDQAKRFYRNLKLSGFRPNSSNLQTMINLQAKNEDEVGAQSTVDDMMMIGCQKASILGIVLQAYEKAERFEKVTLVLNGSLYDHVLMNQTSCSMLVIAYAKNSLINEALKVLGDKRWKDPVFEDNLYHLLICSCKEMGHLEEAVKVFSFMPKCDNKPNLHIFCTMIDIYGSINLCAEAERLYLDLKDSEVDLDMIAFSIVIRMYTKSGSLEKACQVLDLMEKQKNIVPDVYLLRDMLRIYQRCGMLDKLAKVYYNMLKNDITWDQEMYNCVINCCARALPVDELTKLFDEMLRHGFTPNSITLNVMLDVYRKSGLLIKASRLFSMAKRKGLVDVVSYNTMVAAYGKTKDFKSMSATTTEMQFNGFSVSLVAYNSMLDAYGKEGEMEKFRDILRRMKESSCASDNYTYNILINIYGEQGWIDEVYGVLMELKDLSFGLDLCGYNTLIKAYGLAGMVEEAVALVKEMRGKGIEPDRITYINLINALRRNDMYLEAVKWSLWLKQLGL